MHTVVKLCDKGRPYYGCPNIQIHTYSFNRWLVSQKTFANV